MSAEASPLWAAAFGLLKRARLLEKAWLTSNKLARTSRRTWMPREALMLDDL